ncbi:MAG: hypothetical protein JST54_13890 [Deltaproteobacteria bacterium]|nr:hypothetical protein [Deltaproteobacteria bacterium]
MRTQILLATVLMAAVSSGCVIREHDTTPPPAVAGDVNMEWSFGDGTSCSSFIDHMQVTIAGEVLDNGGVYPCNLNGIQGVQLLNFAPGAYSFTVSAIDFTGHQRYTSSGTFTVNGDVTVSVILQSMSTQQPGNLTVFWAFPNNINCAEAGVDHVQVTIPGEALDNNGYYPCSTSGSQGIVLTNFGPGTYPVTVNALDSNDNPLYVGSNTAFIDGDQSVTVALAQTYSSNATLQLRWGFLDAQNNQLSCATAGVSNVQITINNFAPSVVPCSQGGVQGSSVGPLNAGSYTVVLDGLDANGNAIYSTTQTMVVSAPITQVTSYLAPLYGSWDLSYNFANAASCAAAGVTEVSLSVTDGNGNEISGQNPGTTRYPCGDQPNNVFSWQQFPGGDVVIQLFGYSSHGAAVPTWGATRATTLLSGAANDTTVTMETCGTNGSGC